MSQITNIEVNHLVLKWARESLAISKNKAIEELEISALRLTQLEDGTKLPTLNELHSMSKLYKRTIATLLLNEPPVEKPIPKDRRSVNSSNIGEFHDKTILAVRKARVLAQSYVSLREENNLPLIKLNYKTSIKDNPILIAAQFRKVLNLNDFSGIENISLALEGYIERVESLGVAIFQLSLTQDNLRGFSITDDIIPIIGIKGGGEPPTAKIFTLFHELGHILLNDGGMCDISFATDIQKIEKWCNAFAGEILVPTDQLLNSALVLEGKGANGGRWSKNVLGEIGRKFHVGPLVILRRLLEHNLTSSLFYQEKHSLWNRPSFGRSPQPEGRNIPKETIKEKGRNYIRLAFQAFDQNKIDLKDLSDFLGVKLSYIPKTRQLLMS